MDDTMHLTLKRENEGTVDFYKLAPGINLSFNQIYTSDWTKGDSSVFSEDMLILNFCIKGRCDATLDKNQHAIICEHQICISTILPIYDFYYPSRLYEGIQLFLDRSVLRQADDSNFLIQMGISVEELAELFCSKKGLYLHEMSPSFIELVTKIWNEKDHTDIHKLRYFALRLLYEINDMPKESELNSYFTRSQIAIVKEAEALIMQDLSKRITAKEMAEHFGVSESSFKLYIKGILGESYLAYFRRKRMEQAADMLKSTNLKIIDISNAVGYENQGKFAKAFFKIYGMTPLEFRRLSSRSD